MIPELAARQDAHSAQTAIHQFRGGRAMTLQLAYDELLTELPIQLGAPASASNAPRPRIAVSIR